LSTVLEVTGRFTAATISGYPVKSDGEGDCVAYGLSRRIFIPKATESPRAR
jgi:hypothetical protein